MALDTTTANILANEARRRELQQKVARLQGTLEHGASLATMISTTNGDTQRMLQQAQAELAALEAGAGPGITDDFGHTQDILAAFITAAEQAGTITAETATALREQVGLTG